MNAADDSHAPQDSPHPLWTACVGFCLLLAILTMTVFTVRFAATLSRGDLFEMTGMEAPPIYDVWKRKHGHPVYVWPQDHHGDVSFYNVGFYETYGAITSLLPFEGAAFVTSARMITVLATTVGCLITYLTLGAVSAGRNLPHQRVFVASFAIFVWFGSSSTSWYALAVRPDMLSMCLVAAGLWCFVLSKRRRHEVIWLLLASIGFGLAWWVKQSTIGVLCGAGLCCLIHQRSLRAAVLLSAPAAAIMAATLLAGNRAYFYNVIELPSLSRIGFYVRVQFHYLPFSLVTNPLVWFLPLLCLEAWRRQRRPQSASPTDGWRLVPELAFPAMVAVIWSVVCLLREGSDKNTLLEGYLALATWSAALLLVNWGHVFSHQLTRLAACVLAATTVLFPLAQLVFFDRVGDLNIASAAESNSERDLADFVRSLPKPLLAEHPFLNLPWCSTNNRYPAMVTDDMTMAIMQEAGHLEEHPFLAAIRNREPVTIMAKNDSAIDHAARDAGYHLLSAPTGNELDRYRFYGIAPVR